MSTIRYFSVAPRILFLNKLKCKFDLFAFFYAVVVFFFIIGVFCFCFFAPDLFDFLFFLFFSPLMASYFARINFKVLSTQPYWIEESSVI